MKQNPMAMFNTFMQNPMQFLAQRKLNIPQNLQGNPQAMVQHLLNTGQMDQQTYDKLNALRQQNINQQQ